MQRMTFAFALFAPSLVSVLRDEVHTNNMYIEIYKKGKRKVQGMPQSQPTALPKPQEEEEADKSKQTQTKQTYEKH